MKTWLKTVFGVTTLAALALVVICIVLRPSRGKKFSDSLHLPSVAWKMYQRVNSNG